VAGGGRARPASVHHAALPRLLDLLDALALRATFFVEAINTREYPAALLEIAARGHEVGFHAWRHERWGDLATDDEQDVIDRSSRPTRSSASTSGRSARPRRG
jgi:peptidoglycan/xylan/chitin deacetylase (PgdA/CDA1 family)